MIANAEILDAKTLMLGGWLEVISGWRSVFVLLAVFGFLLLVACAFKLPESLLLASRSPLRLRATLKDYATVGSDARFFLQSISIALAASALFLYISSAPVFVLQILHLPDDWNFDARIRFGSPPMLI